MDSNELYRKLNKRFDKRAFQLLQMGFKYEQAGDYNIAVFVVKRFNKNLTIAAGTVLHANSTCWSNEVKRAEMFLQSFGVAS